MKIPLDMIDQAASKKIGGTVVSIRDMLICLGSSDDELREHDRISALRKDILAREPWRDKTWKRRVGILPNGMELFVWEGQVDWSGTEMEGKEGAA